MLKIILTLCLLFPMTAMATQNILFKGPYVATVKRVIDGDTIVVQTYAWPTILVESSVRINGINTPEVRTRKACEKKDGLTAKKKAIKFLGQTVKLYNVRIGKFGGRVVADVKNSAGHDYAKYILMTGYAVPYNGKSKKPTWICQ